MLLITFKLNDVELRILTKSTDVNPVRFTVNFQVHLINVAQGKFASKGFRIYAAFDTLYPEENSPKNL